MKNFWLNLDFLHQKLDFDEKFRRYFFSVKRYEFISYCDKSLVTLSTEILTLDRRIFTNLLIMVWVCLATLRVNDGQVALGRFESLFFHDFSLEVGKRNGDPIECDRSKRRWRRKFVMDRHYCSLQCHLHAVTSETHYWCSFFYFQSFKQKKIKRGFHILVTYLLLDINLLLWWP